MIVGVMRKLVAVNDSYIKQLVPERLPRLAVYCSRLVADLPDPHRS